jgi:hypothetical protein
MANAVKWTNPSAEIKIIENAEPAAGATVTGTLDNTSSKDRWLDLQLKCQFSSDPAAGGVFTVRLTPRSVWTPDAAAVLLEVPVGTFPVVATTSAQILATVRNIAIGPFVYDVALTNNTSQNASVDSVQLSGKTYSEGVQ